MKRSAVMALSALLLVTLAACGEGDTGTTDRAPETEAGETGLTPFEEEHGIGPFTDEIVLADEVDEEMARMGQEVYEFNCEACHMLDESFVGPALGDVLDRRSPTWIANMIMNPEEMTQRHPVARELLQQYPMVMPYQNISEEQARAMVEYFRTTR